MIDAEVFRLRKLRETALRTRAMAEVLESRRADEFAPANSAVVCWSVARIVTGHLRAHPNLSCQKGPSRIRELGVHALLPAIGMVTREDKLLRMYAVQLRHLARELDDARALTRSAHLSDTLGRLQVRMRRLMKEIRSAAGDEAAALCPAPTDAARGEIASDWPYLAI